MRDVFGINYLSKMLVKQQMAKMTYPGTSEAMFRIDQDGVSNKSLNIIAKFLTFVLLIVLKIR